MIGLRHDVDTLIEFRKGLPELTQLEDRYDARSTLFVRATLLKPGSNEVRFLKRLEEDDWEIGLHLDNTVGDPNMLAPEEELKHLQELGFRVKGVSPHGGIYGFQGEKTWKVMDSLGLYYMMGYPPFPDNTKTIVLGPHYTLDFLVKEKGTYNATTEVKRKLEFDIEKKGWSIIMVHPVYMYFSVGPKITMASVNIARKQGFLPYVIKQVDRSLKLFYTILGYKTIKEPYEEVLKFANEKKWKLTPLYRIVEILLKHENKD